MQKHETAPARIALRFATAASLAAWIAALPADPGLFGKQPEPTEAAAPSAGGGAGHAGRPRRHGDAAPRTMTGPTTPQPSGVGVQDIQPGASSTANPTAPGIGRDAAGRPGNMGGAGRPDPSLPSC